MSTVREHIQNLLEKPGKITIPEVLFLYNAYFSYPGHNAGGALHIVLSDNNIKDSDVKFCIQLAIDNKDEFGELLGRLLLKLSKTQRLKLSSLLKISDSTHIRLDTELSNFL